MCHFVQNTELRKVPPMTATFTFQTIFCFFYYEIKLWKRTQFVTKALEVERDFGGSKQGKDARSPENRFQIQKNTILFPSLHCCYYIIISTLS